MLVSDNELLGKFLVTNDEHAFEQLVKRHSPMVMSVCKNLLLHPQDAEDAFQATFLVLSRKANQLLAYGTISGWLYSVAVKNCHQVRRQRGRARETVMIDEPTIANEPWLSISNAQESDLIHQEINRLPDRYRDVIVLCHLEGFSRSEAAEFLDATESSIKAALARARNLLRKRLVRRGIVATTVLGTLSTTTARAAEVLDLALINNTVDLCLHESTAPPPVEVLSLVNHGAHGMKLFSYAKMTAYVAGILTLATVPMLVVAQQFGGQDGNTAAGAIEISLQESDSNTSIQIEASGTENETVQIADSFDANASSEQTVASLETEPQPIGIADSFTDAEERSVSPPVFNPQDTPIYWEMKRKAYLAREMALREKIKLASEGEINKFEHHMAESEYYETKANIIVAELNLGRLQQVKNSNQKRNQNPLIGHPLNSGLAQDPFSAETSIKIPRGYVAITIKADAADVFGANLNAGSSVRVVGIVHKNQSNGTADISSKTVLDKSIIYSINKDKQLVTLVVDKLRVDELLLTAEIGKLRLFAIPDEASTSRDPSENSSLDNPPPASDAMLKPGERLIIEFIGLPEMSNRKVTVSADHIISIPFAGNVTVKGKTTEGAAKEIRRKLKPYFNSVDHIYLFRESASVPLSSDK